MVKIEAITKDDKENIKSITQDEDIMKNITVNMFMGY